MSEDAAKKRRAPARKFTPIGDHEAVDHARWSYARMRHLAKLVLNGETEEAAKMARVLTGKDKATSHAMVKIEQGEMVLRDGGWVLRFLVESMGEALTNSDAENYITASFRLGVGRDSYARDLYSVTLQREGKLTPHERMMRAEKERDAALAEVAKARADIATLQGELSRAVAEGATLRRAGRAAIGGFAVDNNLINDAISLVWRASHETSLALSVSDSARLEHLVGEMASALRTEPDRVRAITADRDAERAMRKSYEEGITWETSCLGCAKLLTDLRATEERAERAENAVESLEIAALVPARLEEAARALDAVRPKPLSLDEFEALVRAGEKPHRAALLEAIRLARADKRPVAEATIEALDVLRADAARRGIAVDDETDRCATCKRDRDVCVCAPLTPEAPHG